MMGRTLYNKGQIRKSTKDAHRITEVVKVLLRSYRLNKEVSVNDIIRYLKAKRISCDRRTVHGDIRIIKQLTQYRIIRISSKYRIEKIEGLSSPVIKLMTKGQEDFEIRARIS